MPGHCHHFLSPPCWFLQITLNTRIPDGVLRSHHTVVILQTMHYVSCKTPILPGLSCPAALQHNVTPKNVSKLNLAFLYNVFPKIFSTWRFCNDFTKASLAFCMCLQIMSCTWILFECHMLNVCATLKYLSKRPSIPAQKMPVTHDILSTIVTTRLATSFSCAWLWYFTMFHIVHYWLLPIWWWVSAVHILIVLSWSCITTACTAARLSISWYIASNFSYPCSFLTSFDLVTLHALVNLSFFYSFSYDNLITAMAR